MERLIEIKTHVTGFCYADKKEGVFVQDVFDRLAAYEDTKLTPEQIEALTADKDEQAGRIMQMEEALRQTKTVINDLMACNEISNIADVRGEEAIKAIEALLGGAKDGN